MYFDDVLGQEDIKTHLESAIKSGKISHAYLFTGEEGMGKLMMARAFAQALLCEEKAPGETRPCGTCHSCRQADSLNHPDIIFFRPGDAPDRKVSDYARSKVVGDMQTRPYQSKYKIYIIEEAHTLSEQVQNILLKSIEEPPSYVISILLCANRRMMIPTILSRCVEMPFRPVATSRIVSYLKQNYEITDAEAQENASFAFGNVGRAIRQSEDSGYRQRRESVIGLLSGFHEKGAYEWMPLIGTIGKDRALAGEYVDLIGEWLRDVLFYKTGAKKGDLCYDKQEYALKDMAEAMSFEDIDRALRGVEVARRHLAAAVDIELVMLNLFDSFLPRD